MTENGSSSKELGWSNLRTQAESFVSRIEKFTDTLGLDVSGLEIDHIGMRVSDPSNVEKVASELGYEGTQLSKAVVNGRPIMIYELQDPIKSGGYKIPYVELPYPAPNHDFPEDGWEHVEFVIPSDAQTGEEFLEDFKQRFPDYQGELKVDSPKVEGEQLANPTVVIKNPADKMQCIKFHPRTIKEIVLSGK